MVTMRNNASMRQKVRKRNKAIINSFIGGIAYAAGAASELSMHSIARMGLRTLVDEAYFNDYTGVLINSYQAAVISGGIVYGGDFAGYVGRHGEEVIEAMRRKKAQLKNDVLNGGFAHYDIPGEKGDFIPQLYTSYGVDAYADIKSNVSMTTTPTYVPQSAKDEKARANFKEARIVSRRSEGNKHKRIPVRKIRTSKYAESIKYRGDFVRQTRSKFPNGYGRDISRIRTAITDNMKRNGVYVIFNNPTPYAAVVHNSRKGHGEFHKVFPTSHPVTGAHLRMIAEKNLKRMQAYLISKYKMM